MTWTCDASHCLALALEFHWQVVAARLLPLLTHATSRRPFCTTPAGVLSEAHNRGARDAAREAWLRAASRTPGVTAQFLVFGADNDTLAAAAQQEAEQLGDIMLVDVEHASR